MNNKEQIPSVSERKAFWLWSHAHSAFKQVIAACGFLVSPGSASLSTGVKSTIEHGVIVSYCKPFKSQRGVAKLDRTHVPHEYLWLHDHIEDLRDKTIVHFDATGFQADASSIGNINQVRIKMSDQRYDCSVLWPNVGLLDWKMVRLLAECLCNTAKSHVEQFSERFLSRCFRPSGLYRLNLEESSDWLLAADENNN